MNCTRMKWYAYALMFACGLVWSSAADAGSFGGAHETRAKEKDASSRSDLSRRQFIKGGVIAGVAALAGARVTKAQAASGDKAPSRKLSITEHGQHLIAGQRPTEKTLRRELTIGQSLSNKFNRTGKYVLSERQLKEVVVAGMLNRKDKASVIMLDSEGKEHDARSLFAELSRQYDATELKKRVLRLIPAVYNPYPNFDDIYSLPDSPGRFPSNHMRNVENRIRDLAGVTHVFFTGATELGRDYLSAVQVGWKERNLAIVGLLPRNLSTAETGRGLPEVPDEVHVMRELAENASFLHSALHPLAANMAQYDQGMVGPFTLDAVVANGAGAQVVSILAKNHPIDPVYRATKQLIPLASMGRTAPLHFSRQTFRTQEEINARMKEAGSTRGWERLLTDAQAKLFATEWALPVAKKLLSLERSNPLVFQYLNEPFDHLVANKYATVVKPVNSLILEHFSKPEFVGGIPRVE